MLARMRIGLGTITAIALMVLALWVWGQSADLAGVLASSASRPALELWSVRLFAIAAGAAAQLLLLSTIVSAAYSRRLFDELMRTGAGVVASIAVLGAMALALMGR